MVEAMPLVEAMPPTLQRGDRLRQHSSTAEG